MRLTRSFHVMAIATSMATTSELPAQFSHSYGITKSASFTQSSALPPAPSVEWLFSAFLSADGGEATTVTIDTPTGQRLTDAGDRFFSFSSPTYPSLAPLDAAFPNGAYTFRITAGTLAPASASVSFPTESRFPSSVPYFNGDTFDRLAAYDACQSFTFNWNQFVPHPNANRSRAVFSISRVSPFGLPVFFSGTNFATVPGGLLEPNTVYRARLRFVNESVVEDAGFNQFEAYDGFEYSTTVTFVTLPEIPREGLTIRCSQVELRFSTSNNFLYQVQYRSALTTNQWTNLGQPIQGDGSCKTITDDIPQVRPQRFYRTVTLP
jgi:hypothetical protein